jgi:cyclic beta-1,2-glucan synthetase
LDFLGLDAEEHHRLQRMAALLVDGSLAAAARGFRREAAGVSREALWSLGISGDRPILAMACADPRALSPARDLVRAHGFYRAMGLETDLALVDAGGVGYDRPVRDGLENLIASSHLNRSRCVPGGVWLLEGEGRRALERFASATFTASAALDGQVRSLLRAVGPASPVPPPMDPGQSRLAPMEKLADNGFGGFIEGGGYAVDLSPDRLPPAPWCNILANDAGGMLLSERGGGFFWQGNSRSGRLTPYGNDGLCEGWGLRLVLTEDAGGGALSLLPA